MLGDVEFLPISACLQKLALLLTGHTITMTDYSKLITHLRSLALLTQTEAQVAQIRVPMARTEAVRKELTQNARNANDRADALLAAIRDLGGVPDVVTPVVGRVTAVVKGALEQGQPFDEALLGDLDLEHQLLDRARYVKVLAKTARKGSVEKLADRLIVAHTATVEWLTVVLAEEALGGPSALVATPVQRLASGASRLANAPARFASEQINRTVDSVTNTGAKAKNRVAAASERTSQVTDLVRDALTFGRNATLGRAEKLARRDGDKTATEQIHEARSDAGALSASELPIKNYDQLTIAQAVTAAKKLTEAEDLRAVVRYEETHKNREGVVSAAQAQLASVAKLAAGITA